MIVGQAREVVTLLRAYPALAAEVRALRAVMASQAEMIESDVSAADQHGKGGQPYHLLAKLRDEEMAERARLAARGMAVMAPLHTPSPHLVTAGDEVGGCAPCCECPCHSWLTYQGEHDDTCGWR